MHPTETEYDFNLRTQIKLPISNVDPVNSLTAQTRLTDKQLNIRHVNLNKDSDGWQQVKR